MAKVFLKPGKAKPFFSGEPLVFSGAISRVEGDPTNAQLVDLFSDDGTCIGSGLFNPESGYRVRLIHFARDGLAPDIGEIIQRRLQAAIVRRQKLGLPGGATNAYRLINSEGDGLSGLTLDVYATTCVASITARWLMAHKQVVLEKLGALGFHDVVWLPQHNALKQDGWNCEPAIEVQSRDIEIVENDLKFHVTAGAGQKTGFYCDQRENRLRVRELAAGKNVLDCFCYSGGFALNAALGGARSVTGVDSSATAVSMARENARLNQLEDTNFQCCKVEEFLKSASGYDLIVLDPPKLAPTRGTLPRARQRYLVLNRMALGALNERGVLLSFSCSNAFSQKMLHDTIHKAAVRAKRKIRILETFSAAPDHPWLPKSQYGNYLKGCLVQAC